MTATTASAGNHLTPARFAFRATMAWLLGLLVAVVLGVATVALGVALASHDQRRHIPGHFFQYAFSMAPGLVQLVYLVPL